jgi:hypothetical protein
LLQLLKGGTKSVEFDESKNEEAEIIFDYGASLNCLPLFCAFHLKACRTSPLSSICAAARLGIAHFDLPMSRIYQRRSRLKDNLLIIRGKEECPSKLRGKKVWILYN